MADVVLLIEGLGFKVWEGFQDPANIVQVLDEFLCERLLTELGEFALQAEGAEVLQVDGRLSEVDNRLHRSLVDVSQDHFWKWYFCRIPCL